MFMVQNGSKPAAEWHARCKGPFWTFSNHWNWCKTSTAKVFFYRYWLGQVTFQGCKSSIKSHIFSWSNHHLPSLVGAINHHLYWIKSLFFAGEMSCFFCFDPPFSSDLVIGIACWLRLSDSQVGPLKLHRLEVFQRHLPVVYPAW